MSIFRDSFKKEIREQLSTRQKAMTNRTPQNLQYLNSRNSWIRMVSSVDVNGSADQAKAYVLQGGTLNSDTNSKGEIIYTPKAGIGSTGKEAYSTKTPIGTKHRLGIRPMPGITSIDIKSKSAYGSLREVTVNFQCWDIHQLEELEVLYMRPGYTVLIEWGWTPYLDNDGKYQSTFTDFYSDTILKAGKTERSKIFQDLYDKSIKYGGNYDAMFGYVKNYSWSARPDGGYDCQTIIISTGEIIESLKVNYVRPDLSDFKLYKEGAKGNGFLDSLFTTQGNTPSILFKQAYEKNTLAGIWTELYYKLKDPAITSLTTVGIPIIQNKWNMLNFPGTKGMDSEIDPGSGIRVYVTLEAVFDVLNKFILPKEIIQLSTKTNGYSGTPTSLTCVAHPLQISVDPATCVIKSPLWSGTILTEASGATAPIAQAAIADTKDVVKGLVAASVGNGVRIDDFKKYMDKITPLIFDQVNKAFIDGTEGNDWKFTDGLAGLIKEQFIEKSDQLPSSIGAANKELTSLYYLYQIQQSIKANGINLDVGLVDDETSSNKKKNPVNLSQLPSPTDATFKNVTFEKNNISTPKTTSTQGGSFTTYELAYYDYASSTITITSTNTQEAQTTNTLVFNAGDALKVATNLDKLKQNYFLDNDPKKEIGVIGNIYISLDFLYKQALSSGLESQDSKEKNEINLYNYIKSIASAINTALGSVNNFEVHVDPVDNIARIIDVNYCEPDKKKIDLFELQVHNLNSVVRSYSLQSKIFPNQSAIIAIGSQAQGGELGQQNNTMIDWNTGLVDRILPKKTFPINENALSSNKDDLKMANSLSSIVLLLADLNREPASGQSTIMDDISKAKNALRDLIIYFQSIVASPGANRNLIPTKFSFEMDGIGGLVIGHLFKINDDILPRGYKYTKNSSSILAQTVTSISHAIGNGDWTTTIDALNIILDDIAGEFYTLDIKGIVNRAVEVAIKEAITPTSGAGGSGAGTGGRAPISNNAIATFGKVDNTVPIHGKVILDMLSCTEGTATAGQSGYDILFNFRIIQGWTPDTTAGHPNIAIPFGKTSTTAGGRYGFLYDVWVETNGGKNAAFTKTNQDNAGWKLVKQKISGDENTAEQAYNTAISGVTDVSSNPSFIKMLGLKVAKGQSGYGVGLSYGWASVCDQNGAYIYANQSSDRGTQDMYNIYLQAIKSNGGNTGSPSSSSSTAIVIGDSQTPFIAKQSNAQVEPSLFEGGKNLGWLFNAVKSYKVDTNIKHVIISIGTNGNFNANDKIEGLMALLKARFPNAKFAVVGGSWGWGGNTLSNEGHLAMTYYNRFIAEGVTFVGYIGKTQDPHKDLPEYKTIGNKINTFIST